MGCGATALPTPLRAVSGVRLAWRILYEHVPGDVRVMDARNLSPTSGRPSSAAGTKHINDVPLPESSPWSYHVPPVGRGGSTFIRGKRGWNVVTVNRFLHASYPAVRSSSFVVFIWFPAA